MARIENPDARIHASHYHHWKRSEIDTCEHPDAESQQ